MTLHIERLQKVEVFWVDPSHTSGWRNPQDIKSDNAIQCRTMGYIVTKTSKKLIIAGSVGLESEQFADTTTIPMHCVTELKYL